MLLLTVQVSNATLLLIALIMYGFLGKLAVEPIIISWLVKMHQNWNWHYFGRV